MPSLATISRAENLRRSSRPGFGTRLFCRPIDQHNNAKLGIQLTGISNVQAFNVATNPVRSSHMESVGGFIETFRGLRDGGEIGFEANLFPDGQDWQRIRHDRVVADYTIMDDLFADVSEDDIYEMWVVPPRSTRYVWLARGYPSVGGPAMYEMEGIMRMMMSFKVSGQPQQLYPAGVWTVKETVVAPVVITDLATGITLPAVADGPDMTFTGLDVGERYRLRLVVPRKYEVWSGGIEAGTGGTLAPAHDNAAHFDQDEMSDFNEVSGGAVLGTAPEADFIAMLYREGGNFV